jgi:hypothetical protein
MTVLARDEFTGFGTPATSGSLTAPAEAGTIGFHVFANNGAGVVADSFSVVLTFTTGTVTIKARLSTTTNILVERIVTIPGTNNGTATLAGSAQQPLLNGSAAEISVKVTKGSSGDGLTRIDWWYGAQNQKFGAGNSSGNFNVSGELTATAASYAITGTTKFTPLGSNIAGSTPDGGGDGALAIGVWSPDAYDSGSEGLVGASGTARELLKPYSVMVLTGVGVGPNVTVRGSFQDSPTTHFGSALLLLGWESGPAGSDTTYIVEFANNGDGSVSVSLIRSTNGNYSFLADTFVDSVDLSDGYHTLEASIYNNTFSATIDSVVVATAFAAATPSSTALGGLGTINTRTGNGWDWWEIDDAGVDNTPSGCTYTQVVSRDEFSGLEDDDIEGRTVDGGGDLTLANGQWYPEAMKGRAIPDVQTLDTRDSTLRQQDRDSGWWNHGAVESIDPGLAGPLGANQDYAVRVTGQFHGDPATQFDSQWFSANVRQSHSVGSEDDPEGQEDGYEFLYGVWDFWELYRYDDGVYTVLAQGYFTGHVDPDSGSSSAAIDSDIVVELCVTNEGLDGVRLIGSINGYPVINYLDPIDVAYQAGDPGLCMWDINWIPDATPLVEVSKVEVLIAPTTEFPCEGPPEGPNPYPFPPPPPDPVKGLWVMSPVGAWEFLQLPNPTDPSTDLQVYANLVPRDVQDVKVWANGLWRDLADQNYGNQYDPPDIYPPYFDPCEELPPTENPPDVILGTPPDRLFFTWAISASQLGGLWTATFRAMSPGIVTEINQAAARGGAVFGTPGDKTKFFTGGRYDPAKMDAFIESFAPIKTFLLDAQDAGSFAGLHAADDWENGAKWGGRPLSLSEINRIAAKWKTVITDGSRQVRVMIRARSGQLYQELPNLDGLISQMRMTGAEWDAAGRDPAQYAIIELNYCMARGWILHLSQNFFHGPGSVTAIMSPTDILTNGLAWDDVIRSHPWGGKVLGEGGWEFVSPITTGPYLNVLGDWRNDYQTLGPPS